jgi:hypothetical protein
MYLEERLYEGVIVKIKLTGERGMVLKEMVGHTTPSKYIVRVPDYREIVFQRMEIEKIKEGGK